MSQFVFTNFLETELLDDISLATTIIHITPSMASRLPTYGLVDDKEARLVLWDGLNLPEIVGVVENPGTGYLTVTRGLESTSTRPWAAGTQVVCSLTADIINAALLAYFDISEVLALNFLKLTGGTLIGPLTLSADPTVPLGAATKNYVDNILGNKLPLAGGTMLGSINMNANRILNLPAPVSVNEPIRKFEMDTFSASQANLDGDRSGILTTAGTGASYTLSSLSAQTSLVDGMTFTARFHTPNDDAPIMTLNSTPPKPLRAIAGVGLPKNFIQIGMPYTFIYDVAADAFHLVGAYRGNFRHRAGDFKWSALEVDHDDCLLCDGRALNRVTESKLFNAINTKYGIGDGTTTYNIPLQSGRVLVGRDVNNSQSFNMLMSTTNGLTTATVASAVNLAVGMYIRRASGVAAGTQIIAIVGNLIYMSAAASQTNNISTFFSTMSDPAVTGAIGGANLRQQQRNEVGQHLHGNFLSDPGHGHGHNANSSAGGMSGGGGSQQGTPPALATINAATTGIALTNVDTPAPNAMIMQSASLVGNLFIYAY